MKSRYIRTAVGVLACGVVGLLSAAHAAEPASPTQPGISAEAAAAIQQMSKTLSANEFSFQATVVVLTAAPITAAPGSSLAQRSVSQSALRRLRLLTTRRPIIPRRRIAAITATHPVN